MGKKKPKIKSKGKSKGGFGGALLGVSGLTTAFVFIPTTAMLCFAMLPTVAAALSDRLRGETRALTVGAMNLAGCTPFLLQLWETGHNLDNSFAIITNPVTIIIIYCAAAVGWIIDWSVSGMVATIMQQSGTHRLKHIKERQAALVERWGREVTGDVPLDQYGFPLPETEGEAAPAAAKS